MACSVALKVLEVVQREKLADNAREMGDFVTQGLERLAQKYPGVIKTVRGLGLMIGMELVQNITRLAADGSKTQAVRFANLLHAQGLLTIPAGAEILRFLPPLNLRKAEAQEGLDIIERVVRRLVEQ